MTKEIVFINPEGKFFVASSGTWSSNLQDASVYPEDTICHMYNSKRIAVKRNKPIIELVFAPQPSSVDKVIMNSAGNFLTGTSTDKKKYYYCEDLQDAIVFTYDLYYNFFTPGYYDNENKDSIHKLLDVKVSKSIIEIITS